MKKVLLPVAGLAVLAGSYVAYPYYSVTRLGDAVRTGDQSQLEGMVDWSSVRHGLKADLIALMTGAVALPGEQNRGRQLGQAVIELLGPKVVDSIVEAYATPAGLAGLIRNGGDIDMKAAVAKTAASMAGGMALGSAAETPAGAGASRGAIDMKAESTDMAGETAEPVTVAAQPALVKNTRFVGLNKMEVEFEDPQNPEKPSVKGILTLDGLNWKLSRIVLPVDEMLDAPQTAERPN